MLQIRLYHYFVGINARTTNTRKAVVSSARFSTKIFFLNFKYVIILKRKKERLDGIMASLIEREQVYKADYEVVRSF